MKATFDEVMTAVDAILPGADFKDAPGELQAFHAALDVVLARAGWTLEEYDMALCDRLQAADKQ